MGFLGNLDTALTWILPCLFIVDGCIKVFPFNIELFGEIVSFCVLSGACNAYKNIHHIKIYMI